MICRDHKEFHEQRAIRPKHEESIVYLLMDIQFLLFALVVVHQNLVLKQPKSANADKIKTRVAKSKVLKDPNPIKNIPKVIYIYKDKYFLLDVAGLFFKILFLYIFSSFFFLLFFDFSFYSFTIIFLNDI